MRAAKDKEPAVNAVGDRTKRERRFTIRSVTQIRDWRR